MMNPMIAPVANPHLRGFTLVEMAVVLVILGLLLGGLLIPIGAQLDQKSYSDTRKSLEDAKEALIGYALIKGYFPCPAISNVNGLEDRGGAGGCNKRVGFLPWGELGVVSTDSWGRLYRYSVTPAFSSSTSSILVSPLTNRDITIRTRNTIGALENLSNLNDIPAVIVSHGKNGLGATTKDGVLVSDTSLTNQDEETNLSATGRDFVLRTYTDNAATGGGEFDDIVVWISPNIYISRMVAAGRLP
jgi:prepilin-type N-terminal cleavage/methylation domain-containing protein